jgi:hypothetical protein
MSVPDRTSAVGIDAMSQFIEPVAKLMP